MIHQHRDYSPKMGAARRSLLSLVGAAGLLIASGASANALDDRGPGFTDDDPFANLTSVSDADLAEMRGGFIAGGLNISFGIDVLSLVNGSPVIQYSFTDANLPGPPGLSTSSPTMACRMSFRSARTTRS